jgi:hypothetical protein
MTESKKSRSGRAKKPVEPKVEAPKVEAPKVEEPKAKSVEEAKPEEKVIVSAPVKVEEPKRMKLEPYERPETNPHEGESKWVEPTHNLAQTMYGSGRLKHRMRTRKSRYEQ